MQTDLRQRNAFPWRDFLKKLAAIAIPVALQNLLTTTGSMVDTAMLASLGQTTVGSVGLCAQFTSLMFSGYWGFVGGGMLFFAQYYGAKDDDGVNRSYGLTLCFLLLVGFTFFTAAHFFPRAVMNIYTNSEEHIEIGIKYLKIVAFSYPLMVYSMAMSALLRSTGKVRIPFYGGLCSVITNVIMNWVLIYGHLGAPKMGVEGAALATVIANVMNVAVILILSKAQGHPYLFRMSRHFRWTSKHTKEFLIKCFPIICNEVLMGVGNLVINIVLGRQGDAAINATAVFRTLEGFFIAFFSGFSNASSVLVGTEVGAGNLDTAYERAKRVVYLCGGVIMVAAAALFAVHTPLLKALSLEGESLRIGSGMLLIYSFAVIIRMCNWVQNDTYRSAGDAVYGTVLEIAFMFVVVLPCVCLTGLKFHSTFLPVFGLCYIDEPIRFVLMQIHMYSGKWIKPVTPQGREALVEFRAKHDKKAKVSV